MSHFIGTSLAGFAAHTRHAQRVVFPALLLFMTAPSIVRATETSWQGSFGDWFINSNWTNGVPGGAIVAEQNAFITNGGTALLNRLETNPSGGPDVPAQAADVFVGQIKNTSGTLLVTRLGGAPPAILHLTNLYIGLGGTGATGTVTIASGASVVTGDAGFGATDTSIGKGSQARGTLTVTDPGSSLLTNFVFLGDDTSMGTLNIQNGAYVYCRVASIAGSHFDANAASGSSGSATVTGAGSEWDITSEDNFEIGSKGTGSLTISSGGQVSSLGASIATYSGSNGTVTVTGNGSIWRFQFVAANLNVGGSGAANGGAGTLRIQNGGLVLARGVKCFANSVVDVNNGSSSVAGLVVGEGRSGLPVAGGSPGDILVGSTTGGRMEIRARGVVQSLRGHIGFQPGSDGAVSVSGSGATWTAAGSLFIGNAGVGSLEVLNGGAVTSAGHGYLGFATNTSGYVNVSGAGSTLSFGGSLYVGGNGAAAGGSGTLRISNGGVVSAATATLYPGAYLELGADPTLNASLTVMNGVIEAFADTTFANSFSVGAGGLNVSTSTHNAIFSGQISGSGGLTKQSGQLTRPQSGTLTLTGASDYSGATTVSGGKLLVEGSITSDVTVNSGATLGGNGTVGSVTVNAGGVVAPGDSPGGFTVNGNYTQTSGGILNIEIGGNMPGAGGYDQLVVTGTATLNGTLNLTLVNGFRPAPGDTFSILTSNSESGSFTKINSPGFTVTAAGSGSEITVTVTSIDPPLVILAMARNAGDIIITFDATAARTYRLERNLSLTESKWGSAAGVSEYTPTANGPAQMLDPGGANFPRAFYRVVQVP